MSRYGRPRPARLKRAMRPIAALTAAMAVAGVVLLGGVHAAGPSGAQTISTDPYTSGTGQHATEVEPYAAASGNTIVSSFQVGRYSSGRGATNIGWATSTDGGQTWGNGMLPSLTVDSTPPGPWAGTVDPGAAYDAVHNTWLISSIAIAQSGSSFSNAAIVVNRSP